MMSHNHCLTSTLVTIVLHLKTRQCFVRTIVVEGAAAANGSDVNLSSSECWIMGCGRKRIRLRCFPFLDMFRSRHRMYR